MRKKLTVPCAAILLIMLLIDGIISNLSGTFDTVNTKAGEIAGEVGQTPLAWNSGVFSMIRNLSFQSPGLS